MDACEPTIEDLDRQVEQKRRDAAAEHAKMAVEKQLLGTFRVPACAADPEFLAKRDAENTERERQNEARARCQRWDSLVSERGSRYADTRLENFTVTDPRQCEVLERLAEYQADISARIRDGEGLILFGPKGTGKDHLAMAMARAAIAAGRQVVWKNGMDLFGDFRDAMDKGDPERSMVSRLVGPDVLYLSDPLPPIGPLTPFQATMVFRILDGRYNQRRPTWVTVNVSGAKELDERMGAQNGDRLRDGAMALFCDWPSYRRTRR